MARLNTTNPRDRGRPHRQADATSSDSIELVELWRLLLSGKVTLTDGFSDEQRHFLTLRRSHAPARKLLGRRVRYFERCLLGEQRKLVGADIRLSQSTIAAGMSQCLRGMGLDVAGSRVPMLLVVAAHASRGEGSIRTARLSDGPGTAEQVVSIPRPDSALESTLTAAEFGVVRLVAEGQNHREIARQRGTSVRTIANQLASVFHKLGVSGRSELLHYIVLAYDSSARETQAVQSPLIPGQWLPVRPCINLWTVCRPLDSRASGKTASWRSSMRATTRIVPYRDSLTRPATGAS